MELYHSLIREEGLFSSELKYTVNSLFYTDYVYMHNLWFNWTEFIPIDESECSVYMNAK